MSRPSRRLARSHAGWLRAVETCVRVAGREHVCRARAPEVSAWSVAEQLEHLLLADRRILEGIDRALDGPTAGVASADGGPSFVGRVILLTGVIPRGRGKAPESTTPKGMSPEELASGFVEVRRRVEALGEQLAEIQESRATREHPLLGHFTSARWVRFSQVHHNHHARIVGDILGAQDYGASGHELGDAP